ncbi:MAG: hypothetical protein HGGPFJEG_01537 [Ignavibacteria bacterium]|nr:hypothetical protein [Ignavibacteria bacterium]
MKKILITTLFILVNLCINNINAQTAEEMKAWSDYMTPGKVHEMLATCDGEWSADITMWMDPNAEPIKTTGTSVNKMIMGGRYQISNNTSTMMGMPFEGMNILGFDNIKKVFISAWIDNMGTGMMIMEGPWDEATNSVTLKGKSVDPLTGKDMDMKEVFQIIDNNTQKLEMYMSKDGKELKVMEINYKRK